MRTGVSLPGFLPFPRIVRGICEFDTFFFLRHIFLFSIPVTRYARYEPGGEKDTLFTRFIDADDVPPVLWRNIGSYIQVLGLKNPLEQWS